MWRTITTSVAAIAALSGAQAAGYRSVVEEVVVAADPGLAWSMWTTNEGFRSFFPSTGGIETNIELRPGGPFEILINSDAPEGQRGCDDCRILGYEEDRMLSFTWTNRPDMEARPHKTHVVVTFEPLAERSTRVTLVADGWGEGSDWDIAYDYFDEAWATVLASFKRRIEEDAR
jgi:uncharacterized protein YndB with AHSA1/START domain